MRRIIVFLILTSVVFLLGCSQQLGKPEIREIKNRWGMITDEYTEILTDIVVYNPNPIPIPLKDVQTEVYLNDVKVGVGNALQSEIKASSESTIVISTKIDNDKIPEWWVSHVKNGERSTLTVKGYLVFDLKITEFRFEMPPMVNEIKTDFLKGLSLGSEEFSVGIYKLKVESVKSQWGKVTNDYTEIITTAKVKNENAIPIVITKMKYVIKANGIVIGEGYENETTVIPPKSTADVKFVTRIKNEKIRDWWISHLKNGEKTVMDVLVKPYVEIAGKTYEFDLFKLKYEFKTQLLG